MKSNLLILGAGQYGALVYEIAESLECFNNIDFLDDQKAEGTVGDFGAAESLNGSYDAAIVAIGNATLRLSLTERLRSYGYVIPTLVHKKAYVSPSAKLGDGCVIEPMAVIQTKAEVGNCCFVSAGAVVNHNATVCDGCHIDCNATVPARGVVPIGTKIVP